MDNHSQDDKQKAKNPKRIENNLTLNRPKRRGIGPHDIKNAQSNKMRIDNSVVCKEAIARASGDNSSQFSIDELKQRVKNLKYVEKIIEDESIRKS